MTSSRITRRQFVAASASGLAATALGSVSASAQNFGSADLIEAAPAEGRHIDPLERHIVSNEDSCAHERYREPRFVTALEEELRYVERVDDVARLKLVELSPHDPRETGEHVQFAFRQFDVGVLNAEEAVGDAHRAQLAAAGARHGPARQETLGET